MAKLVKSWTCVSVKLLTNNDAVYRCNIFHDTHPTTPIYALCTDMCESKYHYRSVMCFQNAYLGNNVDMQIDFRLGWYRSIFVQGIVTHENLFCEGDDIQVILNRTFQYRWLDALIIVHFLPKYWLNVRNESITLGHKPVLIYFTRRLVKYWQRCWWCGQYDEVVWWIRPGDVIIYFLHFVFLNINLYIYESKRLTPNNHNVC